MFNILGVVGLTGAIAPITSIAAEVMSRDWPVMLVLTLILLVMVFGFGEGSRLSRREGIFPVSCLSHTSFEFILASSCCG